MFGFSGHPSGSKGAFMKSKTYFAFKAWALLTTLFLSVPFVCAQNESYAISGTLVTPRGIVDDGVILISHGSIEGIGSKIPLPKGTPIIETGGVIFPGLTLRGVFEKDGFPIPKAEDPLPPIIKP
jgi:hypothetical protein